MKSSSSSFRFAWLVALFSAATLGLIAQQAPTAPAPTEKPAAPDTPAVTEPNAATTPTAATEKPAGPGAPTAAEPSAAPTPPAAAAEPAEPAAEKPPLRELEPDNKSRSKKARVRVHRGGDEFPMGDHIVPRGRRVPEAVSIMGSTTIEGDVTSDAVSVMGHTSIEADATVGGSAVAVLGKLNSSGDVKQDAVSVLGGATINGHVGGDAVCVLGNLNLGPKAVVDGDLVCVVGKVNRHADAVVHGSLVNVPLFGGWGEVDWMTTWVRRCLFLGRPLAFGSHLAWAWGVAFAFLAFYLVLALLFGRGIDRCIETLETRPGGSILASVLTVLITPVAMILLVVTVVGALVVPFVSVGLLFAGLFGKAVMLAWVGRRVMRLRDPGSIHPALAVLVGGLIVMLLYTIWGSFLLYKLLSWLGLGVVVYTVTLAMKRDKPAIAAVPIAGVPPPPMPAATPVAARVQMAATPAPYTAAPTVSAGFVGATAAAVPPPPPVMPTAPTVPVNTTDFTTPVAAPPLPPEPPTMPPPYTGAVPLVSPPPAGNMPPPPMFAARPPPIISAATLPRAGFGIRLAAMMLDVLMVSMVLGIVTHSLPRMLRIDPFPQGLMLAVAVYAAVMWKQKGTTIGGVVCGLKVVRIDQREIDWATAIVRAVSCFLSLAAAGLGFIWVAFDDEKQSWHDKIAGTTVVRVPKGISLL